MCVCHVKNESLLTYNGTEKFQKQQMKQLNTNMSADCGVQIAHVLTHIKNKPVQLRASYAFGGGGAFDVRTKATATIITSDISPCDRNDSEHTLDVSLAASEQ